MVLDSSMPSTAPGPLLGIIAIALPLGGALYGLLLEEKSSGGNLGAAIGAGLARYVVFAAACLLGEIVAVAALVRGERPGWLPVMAVLLNLTAVLPPLWFFWSKH